MTATPPQRTRTAGCKMFIPDRQGNMIRYAMRHTERRDTRRNALHDTERCATRCVKRYGARGRLRRPPRVWGRRPLTVLLPFFLFLFLILICCCSCQTRKKGRKKWRNMLVASSRVKAAVKKTCTWKHAYR